MAALIHAKVVKGKKVWYVWGAKGDDKWEREYPRCRSQSEFYDALREELDMPSTARRTDIVFALMNKTWTGTRWASDFALRLRAMRENAGLTQAALAERAGLSSQAIAALEQDARSPTWETVRRLAVALQVGEEEFKVRLPGDEEQAALADGRDLSV